MTYIKPNKISTWFDAVTTAVIFLNGEDNNKGHMTLSSQYGLDNFHLLYKNRIEKVRIYGGKKTLFNSEYPGIKADFWG